MHLDNQAVKEQRTDRGWTQQQLADACGLSLRTIQRVEKEGIASLDTTAALGAVFQVELRALLRVSPPAEPVTTSGKQVVIALISGLLGMTGGVVLTLLLLN